MSKSMSISHVMFAFTIFNSIRIDFQRACRIIVRRECKQIEEAMACIKLN